MIETVPWDFFLLLKQNTVLGYVGNTKGNQRGKKVKRKLRVTTVQLFAS